MTVFQTPGSPLSSCSIQLLLAGVGVGSSQASLASQNSSWVVGEEGQEDCQLLGKPESRKESSVCTHPAKLGFGLGGVREVGSGEQLDGMPGPGVALASGLEA